MAELPWRLADPDRQLDEWISRESPTEDLQFVVAQWLFDLIEDPFKQGWREPGFENMWFAVVPNSQHGTGLMVTCVFWLNTLERKIRVDWFASLAPPFLRPSGEDEGPFGDESGPE